MRTGPTFMQLAPKSGSVIHVPSSILLNVDLLTNLPIRPFSPPHGRPQRPIFASHRDEICASGGWVCFFRLPPLSDAYSGSQTHCEATHHGDDLRLDNSRGKFAADPGAAGSGPCRSETRDSCGHLIPQNLLRMTSVEEQGLSRCVIRIRHRSIPGSSRVRGARRDRRRQLARVRF